MPLEVHRQPIYTCRSRDSGRHCLKVSLLRKLWKKAGQLGDVKLLPMVESNGLGSKLWLVGVAVLILPSPEDAVDA